MLIRLISAAAVLLAGCGAPQEEPQQFPDADDPAYAASFDEPTDPRVSTSAGEEGGVVVLYPRVIPAEGAEGVSTEALAVQRRLQGLVERALPGRALDVRPAPQRVCPHRGCRTLSVGAVLVHRERGCAVVATVSQAGESAQRLVAWTASAQVRSAILPFREFPESQIDVRDYTPCADLDAALGEHDDAVVEAIQAVGGDLETTTGQTEEGDVEAP